MIGSQYLWQRGLINPNHINVSNSTFHHRIGNSFEDVRTFKPAWLLVIQKIRAAFSYKLSYAGKLYFSVCLGWYLKVQLKSYEWGKDRSPHRSDYEVLFPLKARLSHPIAESPWNLWTSVLSSVKVPPDDRRASCLLLIVCFPGWFRCHLLPQAAWKFPPCSDFRLRWVRQVLHQCGQ